MPNPFYTPVEQPKNSNMTLGDIVQAFHSMLSMGGNPMQIQQVLLANNPNMKKTFDEINQSGMNPLDYAMKKAMEKNIDVKPAIQQMVNMINQNNNRRY